MTTKELLIMQSIAEYKKYKELELGKAKQELKRGDLEMSSYHQGKADGLELAILRLNHINNLK